MYFFRRVFVRFGEGQQRKYNQYIFHNGYFAWSQNIHIAIYKPDMPPVKAKTMTSRICIFAIKIERHKYKGKIYEYLNVKSVLDVSDKQIAHKSARKLERSLSKLRNNINRRLLPQEGMGMRSLIHL
jgi:hypothetical protein